jgi:N4-gp56 family major capsid protein
MASQLYGTNSTGGFLSNPELSQKLRVAAQPLKRFRAFTSPLGAGGAGKSANVFFDKIGNVQTAGGVLTETTTMSETFAAINRGTATMQEYGNAIAYTGKLISLSQLNPEDAVAIALRNDAAKVLDSQCALQYQATEFKAVLVNTASVAFTTNGTATATAGSDLTGPNVRSIVNYMRIKNIPYVDGSNYVMIASVQAYQGLFTDGSQTGGFVDSSKYTDTLAGDLFRGEVGKFYTVRIVEETNVLSNSVGTSAGHGEAVVFGDDAVKEVVAIPEELREKIPLDYGRSQGLAWYAILGFQIIWNFATDAEQHIVHVTSA